jgi:hypothetical protein
MPTPPITVHSHLQHKKTAAEVIVTRVTIREISYIAADKSFSGSVSQWVFLHDFEPLADMKKNRPDQHEYWGFCDSTGLSMLGRRTRKTFHDPSKSVNDSAPKQRHAEEKQKSHKETETVTAAARVRVKGNKAE